MRVVAIFGGPGTGKTTYLSKVFADCVRQYGAENVAFVSYTKSQVWRDKSMAKKAAKIKYKQMKRFKTLHSISRENYDFDTEVFDEEKVERMSVYLGNDMSFVARGIDYMKNILSTNDAVGANKAGMDTKTFQKYKYFYEQVKKGASNVAKKTIDFSDMIADAVDVRFKIDVKAAIVDECQDFSPLQWKAVYTFFRDVDVLYVAGDPNQALYRFSGGQSNYMLFMRCDQTVMLDKSYRCCQSVMLMAEKVWGKIKDKASMPAPSDREDGFAVFYPDFNIKKQFVNPMLRMVESGKSVMVLANTYYQLKQMKDRLFGNKPVPHNFYSGKCKYKWKADKRNVITFSTVHQAKGLEADFVLYDVACGQTGERSDFGYETERWEDYWKMVYTGITRAKSGLVLCELSKTRAGEPSCLDLLYYAKYNFDKYRKWLYLKPIKGGKDDRE